MSRVYNRLTKIAYDYGHGTVQTTRPVYEMSDRELSRRLAYEKGETGMHTGLGAAGGALFGGLAGARRGPTGALVGAGLGGAIGAGGGYISQKLKGIEAQRETNRRQKTASVGEYSALFDAIADGHLGEATKEALAGVCTVYDNVYSSSVEKVATLSNEDSKLLTETEARSARLDQLLRR